MFIWSFFFFLLQRSCTVIMLKCWAKLQYSGTNVVYSLQMSGEYVHHSINIRNITEKMTILVISNKIQCNLILIRRCLINIYLILSTLITFPLRLALFMRLHIFFPKQEGRWSIMRWPSHYCHNEHVYRSVVLVLFKAYDSLLNCES